MPQMSPLGWVWLVIFVSLGYILFMMVFYSMFVKFLNFSFYLVKLNSFNWLW